MRIEQRAWRVARELAGDPRGGDPGAVNKLTCSGRASHAEVLTRVDGLAGGCGPDRSERGRAREFGEPATIDGKTTDGVSRGSTTQRVVPPGERRASSGVAAAFTDVFLRRVSEPPARWSSSRSIPAPC